MGWKGTIRSIGSAVRAAERDSKRRQRELDKRQKEYEKMQALEQAAYEVEEYENYIDIIQSLHKECNNPIDWEQISISLEPKKPKNLNQYEKDARYILENYKPGFIDNLFKREEKKKKTLKLDIENAIKKDNAEYDSDITKWNQELIDWKERVEIAKLLINGDAETKLKVLEDLNPFSEISNLGSNITIRIDKN